MNRARALLEESFRLVERSSRPKVFERFQDGTNEVLECLKEAGEYINNAEGG